MCHRPDKAAEIVRYVPKADLALCESFRQPLRAYGARSW
jgi:hypothetical protein